MGNKRKGQLTNDFEWHKHLRKIGKRFFWKGERLAEKKMIEENISELEMDSVEELYCYLILKLPSSIDFKDLYNLCFSLFCALDILPKKLRSLKITKDVLAVTFMRISIAKNITEYTSKRDWINQINSFLNAKNSCPNHENARKLINTN